MAVVTVLTSVRSLREEGIQANRNRKGDIRAESFEDCVDVGH